jgi:putative phosphoribosyl transferase
MLFRDRQDAALQLIPALEKFRGAPGVVFAVPRGGVPIGYYIAQHYNLPLELLLIKKIGHPLNKEVAVGAVSLEDYEVEGHYNLPPDYVEKEVREIALALQERYKRFMGENHQPTDVKGKTVIIIDDGVATGNTILSAIRIMRKKNPGKIVVAVPVASPHATERIREEADELICLHEPDDFYGVGQFYSNFSQVSDDEVEHFLKQANSFGTAA